MILQDKNLTNISIAFCVNNKYLPQVMVTMTSILCSNSHHFDFYIFSSDLSAESQSKLEFLKTTYPNFTLKVIYVDKALFKDLKLNISYISLETYFRYILADALPDLNKVLYLDADLIVNGDLKPLWDTDLTNYYFAGVEDLYIEHINHKPTIGLKNNDIYVNAGVLLMNLKALRADDTSSKLIKKTLSLFDKIKFQDQDILNLYAQGKIKKVDSIYNFTAHNVNIEKSKRKSAVIIHYTGEKKPWNKGCKNKLKNVYVKYEKIMKKATSKKIKVGLIIDEFFGGANTAFGGYGFLARKYIAKYIPNENIQIDVLLGRGKKKLCATKFHEDDVDLYKLPKFPFAARWWLKKKNYDVYLSIELVNDYVLRNETNPNKKLILWIQDPRPKYEWEEIETVQLFKENNYYNQKIYNFVHNWYKQNRIHFISQAHFLNQKAKDLYDLDENVKIQYLPNCIEIDKDFDINSYPKKNNIIFLGRIESVKRGWLFCEIAKKMPEYNFYMLGQSMREKSKNDAIMAQYNNISNLHFAGHVDGKIKEQYLKDAKILVNTSIHEALPISFIEALSYGVCLVSNRNPENLTSNFGIWTGQINGDGFDKVDLYIDAIRSLMLDDERRKILANSAKEYVKNIHNVDRFIKDLRDVIINEVNKN